MESTSLTDKIHHLNTMFIEGKVMEAFEKYYAEDVIMQENEDEPTIGKEENRKRELDFINKLVEVREAKPLKVTVGIGVTMVEWKLDYTHEEWGERDYKQVSVQNWKDGKIVKEVFYYGS